MSIYRCDSCGCVENTALSLYWVSQSERKLCSECDPAVGKWHGVFEKKSAKGYVLANDGFLYAPENFEPGGYCEWRVANTDFKPVRVIE